MKPPIETKDASAPTIPATIIQPLPGAPASERTAPATVSQTKPASNTTSTPNAANPPVFQPL